MTLNLLGADGETETTIRLKLWYVITLVIGAVVWLSQGHFAQETRLCVAEKAAVSVAESVKTSETKMQEIDTKLDKLNREQDLFFSLREPRWPEWKAWAEKKRQKAESSGN